MERSPCVYLLASGFHGTLYIGVTSNLIARIWQHREGVTGGFTQRYGIKRLVWFEVHETMESAILREKRVKRWSRKWKYAHSCGKSGLARLGGRFRLRALAVAIIRQGEGGPRIKSGVTTASSSVSDTIARRAPRASCRARATPSPSPGHRAGPCLCRPWRRSFRPSRTGGPDPFLQERHHPS